MENYIQSWYQQLSDCCNLLTLEKIYPNFCQARIKLDTLYVNQNTINDAKYGIGRRISNSQDPVKKENLIPLENKISSLDNNRIAILGDLGSGKTVFINYLAKSLAMSKISPIPSGSPFVQKYFKKFVIVASLKDLAITENSSEEEFLKEALKKNAQKTFKKKDMEDFFQQLPTLLNEGVILFLDGYDEIDLSVRKIIGSIIDEICKDKKNTVILTSRTYLYENNLSEFNDFSCLRIEPFNKSQIIEYVNNWVSFYNNDYGKDMGITLSCDDIENVIFQKEYLMELATSPLFLSLLLLLYTDKAEKHTTIEEFPVNRTLLYKEIVSLLLSRWSEGSINIQTEQVLEEAAYNDLKKNESSDLFPELCACFSKLGSAGGVIEQINAVAERTGLLIHTGNDKYAFLHRSFQEYFAAGYIIRNEDFIKQIMTNLKCFERWKECDVFIISRLSIDKLYIAIAILNYLVPETIDKRNPCSIANLCVASEALIEIIQLEPLTIPVISDIRNKIRNWLVYYISNKDIEYSQRFTIGDYLGRIGDNRKGVNIIKLDNVSYPDIEWISIEGGSFIVGTEESVINKPREVNHPKYYISKYPITNAQYKTFIDDGGYHNKRYWTKEGWKWVEGDDHPYFDSIGTDRYSKEREQQYREWLEARNTSRRLQPFWWQEEPWNITNRPVVGITWYEALAFCNWLNEKIKENPNLYQLPHNMLISLPSIEEWEHAARGPQNYTYPWGNVVHEGKIRSNTMQAHLNQTSPVGMFPEGKSRYGAYDFAGNVYEWIITGIEINIMGKQHLSSKDNINKSIERIVMGGAWNFDLEEAKCAFTEWDFPIIFDQNTGFRIVAKEWVST